MMWDDRGGDVKHDRRSSWTDQPFMNVSSVLTGGGQPFFRFLRRSSGSVIVPDGEAAESLSEIVGNDGDVTRQSTEGGCQPSKPFDDSGHSGGLP